MLYRPLRISKLELERYWKVRDEILVAAATEGGFDLILKRQRLIHLDRYRRAERSIRWANRYRAAAIQLGRLALRLTRALKTLRGR